jgi:hypothetical protein
VQCEVRFKQKKGKEQMMAVYIHRKVGEGNMWDVDYRTTQHTSTPRYRPSAQTVEIAESALTLPVIVVGDNAPTWLILVTVVWDRDLPR